MAEAIQGIERKDEDKAMKTTYELITPEYAQLLLNTVDHNRKINPLTVNYYANDMLKGDWDEHTGTTISIDENGILRDGQHRLSAIIKSGKSIHMNVCRGVSENGLYDIGRRRSVTDQMRILKSDYPAYYRNSKVIALIKYLANHGIRGYVSVSDQLSYIDNHRSQLDGFLDCFPSGNTAPKTTISVVVISLYLAYLNGISMDKINNFYSVLQSGMSSDPSEYPIIAYRNYLLTVVGSVPAIKDEVARCQLALKKYLTKSCIKRTYAPSELIWDNPEEGN